MFLTRKIGSFLRGKATRGQVFTAAMLASLLGFVPGFFLPSDLGGGFLQAPGLILGLLFLVLVLNANLGVFGLVTLLAKLVSLVSMPVSFAIGRALVDGPLQPMFKALANAKVTAWFGLDHYATTGGLVLGLFFGTAAGMVFARTLTAFRHRMARAETTAAYQEPAGKVWARLLGWLLLGKGKDKKVSWQELAANEQRALPVRLAGVVVVAVLGTGLWVFQAYYSTPLLTDGLRHGLTAANGATADVGRVELDLAVGSLRVTGLAVADTEKLDSDVFAAGLIEASIDTGALLQKRLVIGTVKVHDARNGSPRATPGTLVEAPPPPPPPPPAAGTKTLDDWIAEAEIWRGRIEQVRHWVERISGSGHADPKTMTQEQQQQQVEAQVAELGYAKARALHLHDDAPLVHVRRIEVHGVDSVLLGRKIDIDVSDFSSNAHLLATPPKFSLRATDGSLAFEFAGPSRDQKGAALDVAIKGLAVDTVFAAVKTGAGAPVRGGTIDVAAKGSLLTHQGRESTVELPLQVTLRDTTFALAGSKETRVDQLVLPIGISGVATRPTIGLDDRALADALLQAGKRELATFVQGQAGNLLGSVPGAAELLDPSKTPAQVVDDAKKAAEDAAKKAAEDAAKKAAEEAKKRGLGEGLKSLLPGGRKN